MLSLAPRPAGHRDAGRDHQRRRQEDGPVEPGHVLFASVGDGDVGLGRSDAREPLVAHQPVDHVERQHRVTDGAEVALYLSAVKKLLQNPVMLAIS